MAAKSTTKGRQLKVYWAEIDGLNDWVVAAPNRPEALKAFGIRQDLFAHGEAGDASDPAVIEAARAQPLTPLRRPKGSSKTFSAGAGPSDWSAAIPKAAKAALARAPATPRRPAKAAPLRKPDRGPLDRAKARLSEIEARHLDALKRLAEDRTRLDEREAREKADYAAAASEARRALKDAERAWRKAGED